MSECVLVEIECFFLALLWNVYAYDIYLYVPQGVCTDLPHFVPHWSNVILPVWSSAKCQPCHNNIYNDVWSELGVMWLMLMVCGGSDWGQPFDESGWDISNECLHLVLIGQLAARKSCQFIWSWSVLFHLLFYKRSFVVVPMYCRLTN